MWEVTTVYSDRANGLEGSGVTFQRELASNGVQRGNVDGKIERDHDGICVRDVVH